MGTKGFDLRAFPYSVDDSVTRGGAVRCRFTAVHDKDRTHLRDFIEVGLVDASWLEKLPRELAERLKQLLETPEG